MVTPPPQGSGRVLARRYHLLRVLGRGAMGAVWEAEDTVLRRPVAVKEVVLPGGLSPEERAVSCERTLREARAIARLGHPNVVTLFDVLDEDARPWVVMELVQSRSLADVIKADGPLHPLRVATVGLAILGALEAAHAAGITHRDVKPGNILLGHDGRVKLTDFGIARAAGDDTITGTGLLVGSPSYIAPEIVKGQGTGPPADLWGLGATLYAAVEGRAPFAGGDAMETLAKVVQDPPAPYVKAGPLVPALAAMLEKDPSRRARPVDARRLLLDVLRGGGEVEQPATAPAPAPPAPAAPAGTALGPALADLLVPLRRRSTDADFGFPPAGGGFVGSAGLAAGAAAARAAAPGPTVPAEVADVPEPAAADGAVEPVAVAEPGAADGPAAVDGPAAADGPGGVAEPAEPVAAEDEVEPDPADEAGVESVGSGGVGGLIWDGPDAVAPSRPELDDPEGGTAAGGAADREADDRPEEPAEAAQPAGPGGDRPRPAGATAVGAGAPVAEPGAGEREQPAPAAASTFAGPAREPHPTDAGATRALGNGARPGAPAEPAATTETDGPEPFAADAGATRALGNGARPGVPGAPAEPAATTETDGPEPFAADAGTAEPDRTADPGQPGDAGTTHAFTVDVRHEAPPAAGPARPDRRPLGTPGDERPFVGGAADRAAAAAGWGRAAVRAEEADPDATTAVRPLPATPARAAQRVEEQPTQLVAPLPFGDPRPAAPPPPIWRGTGADDGSDRDRTPPPFGFPGERAPAERRRRTVAALLAVIVLLLLTVVGAALLVRGIGRGGDDGGTGRRTPSSSPAAPAAIPSGYRRYDGDGFSIGVPASWQASASRGGVVNVREPGSSRFLRLITVGGGSDALKQLTAAEKQFAGDADYRPYRQLRLGNVDYRDYDAAEWEFTFTLAGVLRHVVYRAVVVDGRSYGIYLSVREDRWAASRNLLRVATETFRPGG